MDDLFNDGKTFNLGALASARDATAAVGVVRQYSSSALHAQPETTAATAGAAAFNTRSLTSELKMSSVASAVASASPGGPEPPATNSGGVPEQTAPIQLITRKPVASFSIFCDDENGGIATDAAASAAPSPAPPQQQQQATSALSSVVTSASAANSNNTQHQPQQQPVLGMPTPGSVSSPIARTSTGGGLSRTRGLLRRSTGGIANVSFSSSFHSESGHTTHLIPQNSQEVMAAAAESAAVIAAEVAADQAEQMDQQLEQVHYTEQNQYAANTAALVAAAEAGVAEADAVMSSVDDDAIPAPAPVTTTAAPIAVYVDPASSAPVESESAQSGAGVGGADGMTAAEPPQPQQQASLSPITETSREDEAGNITLNPNNVSTVSGVSGVSSLANNRSLSISTASSSNRSNSSTDSKSSSKPKEQQLKSTSKTARTPGKGLSGGGGDVVSLQLEFTSAVVDHKLSATAAVESSSSWMYTTDMVSAEHRHHLLQHSAQEISARLSSQNNKTVSAYPGESVPFDVDSVVQNHGIGISLDDKSYNVEGVVATGTVNGTTKFVVSDLDGATDEALVLSVHSAGAMPGIEQWEIIVGAAPKRVAAAATATSALVTVSDAYTYADAAISVRRHFDKSLANTVVITSQLLQPEVALYYAIEMLHAYQSLRTSRLIHGSIGYNSFVIPNHTLYVTPVFRSSSPFSSS